jgi:hypothetical protein
VWLAPVHEAITPVAGFTNRMRGPTRCSSTTSRSVQERAQYLRAPELDLERQHDRELVHRAGERARAPGAPRPDLRGDAPQHLHASATEQRAEARRMPPLKAGAPLREQLEAGLEWSELADADKRLFRHGFDEMLNFEFASISSAFGGSAPVQPAQSAQPTARTGYVLLDANGVVVNGSLLQPGAIGTHLDRPEDWRARPHDLASLAS